MTRYRFTLCTLAVVAAACGSDSTTAPVQVTRTYNQVQRLGNPLVSEVFLAKRDHPFHGSNGPSDDVAASRSAEVMRRALAATIVVWGNWAMACGRPTPSVTTAVVAAQRDDAPARELDIAFYTERARRDPTGATDLARLAALYLQRS